jgi:hypothetical protein
MKNYGLKWTSPISRISLPGVIALELWDHKVARDMSYLATLDRYSLAS